MLHCGGLARIAGTKETRAEYQLRSKITARQSAGLHRALRAALVLLIHKRLKRNLAFEFTDAKLTSYAGLQFFDRDLMPDRHMDGRVGRRASTKPRGISRPVALRSAHSCVKALTFGQCFLRFGT
jgi:hypothetical protein